MARTRLRRFFRHGFLPQLLAFEACVRLGSVTRAAEELSLAQPTVSCMLRKLSDACGGPVTALRDRRVVATEVGAELLTLCHDMMEAMERFEQRHPSAALSYDPPAPQPEPAIAPQSPWPSPSPSRSASRWKQRASQCPLARRRPSEAAGA